MVVKVRKSSVNLREKLNELDRPVGIAGEAMLRAETKEEQFNLVGAGRKNLVINGGMDIWQRATSYTSSGLDYYGMDRWWTYNVQGSVERSTDVPPGERFAYSMHINGSANAFGQPIEFPATGVSCLKKNTYYTISFWVKGEDGVYNDKTTGQRVYVTTRYRDNKGSNTNNVSLGTGTGMYSIYPYWTRQQITFYSGDVDPAATNRFFDLEFGGLSIINGDLWFTGIQLEEGREATPFDYRLPGEELKLCRRYFQRKDFGRYSYLALGRYQVNNYIVGPIPSFDPQIMRDTPAVSYGTDTGASFTLVVINLGGSHVPTSSYATTSSGLFLTGGSGLTNTEPQYLEFNAGSGVTGYIELDADI